ncbi:MAG: hypothetical protein AAFX52_02150 [Pseudomonadota bacterium]
MSGSISSERRRRQQMLDFILTLPEAFWSEVASRIRAVYDDSFAELDADPSVSVPQKGDALLQRRFFRCENILNEVGQRFGVSSTFEPLAQNNRHIAYVSNEKVGVTQAYVPPDAGRCAERGYRTRKAKVNKMWESVVQSLFEEENKVREPKALYGIIAHSPFGRAFEAPHQRLGSIELVVPRENMESVESFSFEEISAEYRHRAEEQAQRQPTPKRAPTWKENEDKKDSPKK